MANPILVGYYDASRGYGDGNQVGPINVAGYTPVKLDTLKPEELGNVDIILSQNPDNGNLGSELWENRYNIANAVNDGAVFILHDRYVGDRVEQFLPGFGRTDGIYRDFARGKDIDIAYDGLKTGPGGNLDNNSLDGGNWSSHGYSDVNKLPDGSISLLNTGIVNNSVTFAYGYGEGAVVYSSIPLDWYMKGNGPGNVNTNMKNYTANLLAQIGDGELGGVFAPDPEFTISLYLDSGESGNDFITNNGFIKFDGIGNKDEYYTFSLNGAENGEYKGITLPLIIAEDGTYDLDVTTYKFQNGGYAEQDGATINFTLDTFAQKAITGLTAGSDSGKFNDDNYTNTISFITQGVEEGGNSYFSIDGGNSWGTLTPEISEDGTYQLYTRQIDLAGNVSTPTVFEFTLDTISATPELSINDIGEDTNDRVSGDGRGCVGGHEEGGSFEYKTKNGEWTEVEGNVFQVENGRQNIDVRQIDLAGNVSESENIRFAKRDLVFTHRLLEADGVTEANGLEIASWGSVDDKNRQYVLEIAAESLAGISVEDLDLTLNFNNSLFEVVKADDIQITSKLPLANGALISDDNGGVRIAAGSANGLGNGAGEGIQDKTSVLRLLVNLKDEAYTDTDYTQLINKDGDGTLTGAGIEISANLDETVFADLTTLRDRGGTKSYQTLSKDISVSRALTELTEQEADPIVLGTKRSIGGETFTNLIRTGDSAIGRLATWTNTGDAAATDVNLSIQQGEGYNLELIVGDQIGETINVDDINIKREYDGTVSVRETMDVDVKITALGPAGQIINLDDINYNVQSAGGYSWESKKLRTTHNLITYQGDLNYDGRVSMKDLAFLNAGAKQVEEGGLVTRDIDANFDGKINMEDLAELDKDWGKSLHTGKDKFLGSEKITMAELMQQEHVEWDDNTFKTQNALEATNNFEATLDAPLNVGVIDGDGDADAFNDIQGNYLQDDVGLG